MLLDEGTHVAGVVLLGGLFYLMLGVFCYLMQGCLSYLIGVLVLVDGVMQHQSREQMYLANGLQRLATACLACCACVCCL